MLLRVDLGTGKVAGVSLIVHDLGSAGRLYFMGRCRLDNRRELLGRLQLSQDTSDAELIVQAYLAFGESHPEALLGDFAYAIFDARFRRLWLIRDHMGVVPLYYHRAGNLCIASPSLDGMLVQPDIPLDLDDGVVAEWCVNGYVHNQTDTFYSAIKKVPRATKFSLKSNTTMTGNYWSPAEIEPLQESREPVLVEQLRELLDTAILCRLGSDGGQAAHLSGGLDSTPIAIIAGRACRRQGLDFHTYNWCRPEVGDESDWHEWADARRVARAEGFIHREIEVTPDTLLEELLHHNVTRDGTTMFSYERHVIRHAQANGVSRIFSGFGGDEILTSRASNLYCADLRAGRFLEVLRGLALESDFSQITSFPRLIRRFGRLLQNAWGYIPSDWLSILQKQKQQTRYRLALLKPDFAAFAMNYIHDSKDAYLADSIYMRQMGYVNGGYLQERIESWAILGERHGIDYVYPYIDKRLVEFALALPSQWYYRLGKHRYLYRQAINSRLHDTIKNKGKPAETKRVRQLIKNYHASLCHSSALQRIADTPSVYVDAHSLLVHIMRLRELDLNRCKLYDFEIVALFDLTATFNLSGMH